MSAWNPLKLMRARNGGKHVGLPALATCRGLIKLLAGLQQHRGLSSGWLAGDRRFESRMLQKRQEIEALMPGLRHGVQLEGEAACPCFTPNDWKLFQFKWREVVDGLPQASVQDNIERHNQLIARLLDWLSALGESRIDLPAGRRLPSGLVRNFTMRLPTLSECLGQARALGSSVAAKGGCSSVERVRLTFLTSRAEALLGLAGTEEQGMPAPEAARRLVKAMTTMVRTELLAGKSVAISPERYFETASQAIDAVFAWIDAAGGQVEQALRDGRSEADAFAGMPRQAPGF